MDRKQKDITINSSLLILHPPFFTLNPTPPILYSASFNFQPYILRCLKMKYFPNFFHCQWLDGKKHDWTEQVKCDLEDLNLPNDMDLIQNKSVFSWKNLIKKKAR